MKLRNDKRPTGLWMDMKSPRFGLLEFTGRASWSVCYP